MGADCEPITGSGSGVPSGVQGERGPFGKLQMSGKPQKTALEFEKWGGGRFEPSSLTVVYAYASGTLSDGLYTRPCKILDPRLSVG